MSEVEIMMLAIVYASLLGTIPPADSPPQPADLKQSYEEAKSKAGKTPDEQVKLALWCEAHGLTTQRLHHLTLAVLADPKNLTARGLMGMVAYNGRWLRPEAIAEQSRGDADRASNLAEYEARRLKAPYTADAQFALGVWADEHGLKEQAKAHLTAVIRLDPKRDGVWRKLGYKKHDGRWVTDSQLAAERAEAESQKAADKKWKSLLDQYKSMLDQPSKRVEAEAALNQITDPLAVRSVWAIFASGNASAQVLAVRLFGQIEGVPASRALAVLAIRGKTAEVRRVATETLKHRDQREFVALLVALVRKPLKYDVRPLNGPQSPGVLFVEGERYNIRRFYVQPPPPNNMYLPRFFTDNVPLNPSLDQLAALGLPTPGLSAADRTNRNAFLNQVQQAENRDNQIVSAIAANQNNIIMVQRQLAEDIEAVESMNATIQASNDRVLPLLRDLTGRDYGDDPEAWQRWRLDQAGYAFGASSTSEKPTFESVVRISGISTGHSCFAAGTMVRTIDGERPIETIRAGDLVLVQETKAGALGYQAVIAAYHNPPSPTLKIRLEGSDPVVATGIHRFWKAGQGWTMARDLKVGDPLRTLGGLARVEAIADDRIQPVFNLEVGEGHSFLVGKLGTLVHDNSLVEATLSPFDATARSSK